MLHHRRQLLVFLLNLCFVRFLLFQSIFGHLRNAVLLLENQLIQLLALSFHILDLLLEIIDLSIQVYLFSLV